MRVFKLTVLVACNPGLSITGAKRGVPSEAIKNAAVNALTLEDGITVIHSTVEEIE